MLSYEAYEKGVFDWLMAKHQADTNFTFTVRQSATRDSETDYFIGTKRSGYFATTFWSIPVNFPGSSGDAISLIFVLGESAYAYYFEFTQTQDPKDDQNRAVLELIKTIKNPLVEKYKLARKINENAKMYTVRIAGLKENYASLEDMCQDIDAQLFDIIAIVDQGILSVKQSMQRFTAHRVTPQEFVSLINRLNQRIEKHRNIVKEIAAAETSVDTEKAINSTTMPLNQILYGPPGTGKTYNSINYALSIIEGKQDEELAQEDRATLKARFQQYVDRGQILFTTFHQSMSYEDFVEGIKPRFDESEDGSKQLIYEVESGLFKIACAHAAYHKYQAAQDNSQQKRLYTFDDLYTSFIDYAQESLDNGERPTYKSLSGKETSIVKINRNGSIHALSKKSSGSRAPAPLTKENLQKLYDRYADISEIKSLAEVREVVGVVPRTTEFYAIFGGIKQYEHDHLKSLAETAEEQHSSEEIPASTELANKFNSGVFQKAMADPTLKAKPVVLIIDEINRGNVSAIFGELITLIEESKRAGRDEALEVILPYSKQKFSVPSNLYIVGTMNTADRSVEALDTALRRRFAFVEMMPRAELLADILIENINLQHILTRINERIKVLLDKDHQIGHSYLVNVKSAKDLVHAFNNCIIPLLKEYFYRDEEKIALVLGAGFVAIENETMGGDLFPDVFNLRKPHSKPKIRILEVSEDRIIDVVNQIIG